MKKLFVFAAAISLAGPLLAAQPAATAASSADADLLCVAWAAGAGDQAKSPEEKNGASSMMFYYIGRWEGATGRMIDTGLTPAYVTGNLLQIEAAAPDCLKRGGELAQRLMDAGKRLEEFGKGK